MDDWNTIVSSWETQVFMCELLVSGRVITVFYWFLTNHTTPVGPNHSTSAGVGLPSQQSCATAFTSGRLRGVDRGPRVLGGDVDGGKMSGWEGTVTCWTFRGWPGGGGTILRNFQYIFLCWGKQCKLLTLGNRLWCLPKTCKRWVQVFYRLQLRSGRAAFDVHLIFVDGVCHDSSWKFKGSWDLPQSK